MVAGNNNHSHHNYLSYVDIFSNTRMIMNWKTIDTSLCGAICLLVGWGAATLLHEGCHLAVARSLGLPTSLGTLTLTTGSVFVQGDMTNIETALVAVAGSLGLIIIGWLLTRASSVYFRMMGIMFLSRAWIDTLPLFDLDGAIMAEGTGMVIAWAVVVAAVLVCGGRILEVLQSNGADRISRVRIPSSTSGTIRKTQNKQRGKQNMTNRIKAILTALLIISAMCVTTVGSSPITDNGMKAFVWHSDQESGWCSVANTVANRLTDHGFNVTLRSAPTPDEIYQIVKDDDIKIYWGLGHGNDASAATSSGVGTNYYATTFGDSIKTRDHPLTIGVFQHCGGYLCYTPGYWLQECTQGNDDVVAQRFFGEGWCGDGAMGYECSACEEHLASIGSEMVAMGYGAYNLFSLMDSGYTYEDAAAAVWSYDEGKKQGNKDLRYPQFSGDVNYDNVVDSVDVTLLQNHINNPTAYPIHSDWDADVTGDGNVNIDDLTHLVNHFDDPTTYELKPRGWFATGSWTNPVDAIASSYYSGSHVPTNAIDDDILTHWYSEMYVCPPCWIQFDLGSTKPISKVRAFIDYRSCPMTLDVHVSNDAANWETVVADFTVAEGGEFVEIPFAQTDARYVRLWETNFEMVCGQCTEFDVYVCNSLGPSPNIETVSIRRDVVTIRGTMFGSEMDSSSVYIEGNTLDIISWCDTRVVVDCPDAEVGDTVIMTTMYGVDSIIID